MSVLLILNPKAGHADPDRVEELASRVARERGVEIVVQRTGGAGDARDFAMKAARSNIAKVIAAGGDGTLREVISGVVAAGARTAVGFVPVGTANVMAKSLALDANPEAALGTALDGTTARFDVGREIETGECFVLAAAAGYPADVMSDAPRPIKRRVGVLAYLIGAILNLSQLIRPRRVVVALDGERLSMRAHSVLVVNTGTLGPTGLDLAPGASAHDGRLDVVIVRARTVGTLFLRVVDFLRQKRPSGSLTRRAREIRISSSHALSYQLDGDPIERDRLSIDVVPSAVELVVGAEFDPS